MIDFVRRMRRGGAKIAGVCSGVGLLAASGILDGRKATTHWGLADFYRARFPKVNWCPEAMVTESDGIYCGGGVHAALDLALCLVEQIEGRATAIECAKCLLIDMPRASQLGFVLHPLSKPHGDEEIRHAEEWLREHFGEEFRFDQLAERVGMSPRTLIRRFKLATGCLPIEYLQRLRVEAAKRLLEEGRSSVQELGLDVGYADVALFRALFRRHTGLSPAAHRRRFGSTEAPKRLRRNAARSAGAIGRLSPISGLKARGRSA